MAKRSLCLLLALVTLFSLTVPAFAEEAPIETTEEPVVTEEPTVTEEPAVTEEPTEVTEGPVATEIPEPTAAPEAVDDQPSIELVPPDEPPVYKAASRDEAIAIIRQQLVDRVAAFTIEYPGQPTYEEAYELVQAAMAHTGKPNEGDYLWRHVHTYGYFPATNEHRIFYQADYYTTAEQEAWMDEKIAEVLNGLGVWGMSEYDRIRAIYDYVCDHVVYDNVHGDDYQPMYTAYAALHDGTAVCEGFVTLLYRMLLTAGIDNRAIFCYLGGYEHAWNIVKLGGVYYNVDATWDAHYPDGRQFFLLCDESFRTNPSHERADEYSTDAFYALYPMSATDYLTAATPTPEPTATPAPKLAAPTVKIEKVSTGIKVSWNAVAGSPRYMVYYKEGNGGWKKIGTTTSTTYTRAAKYLKNGVTYQFTVRCCENDKKTLLGPYKASNSLKYVGQLAAPTVKIAKVAGGIKVSWNKIAGSPRYMVYYKENGGSWKKIGTTTATSYTRAAKYLKNGVTYQFTVRCCENDKKTLLGPYKASNSLKYTK